MCHAHGWFSSDVQGLRHFEGSVQTLHRRFWMCHFSIGLKGLAVKMLVSSGERARI